MIELNVTNNETEINEIESAIITAGGFSALNGVNIQQGYHNTLILDYPELGIYKPKTNTKVDPKRTQATSCATLILSQNI